MATPLMTEVFLLEVSMRAWSQLGFSPEAKAKWEEQLGARAYDCAIFSLPYIFLVMDMNPDNDARASAEDALRFIESNQQVLGAAARYCGNPKFVAELRNGALELARVCEEDPGGAGVALLGKIKKANPPKMPAAYDKSEVFLDLGGRGWKWVRVPPGECQKYEGQVMQHCGLADGDMYSLRSPDGKPHVTIEVITDPEGVDSGSTHYDQGVAQIKGKQNTVPDKMFWDAVKQFIKKLPPDQRRVQERGSKYNELRAHLGQPIIPDRDPITDDEYV